ncbi:MAG: ubiquinone biosynthesis regulatory protein kinase UbiB [Coxiellaceae bacterium]|nr:ubiquinone biosynthesis regulatory protein kinase UbiB [Coxiellaceae bacterium]
MKPITLMRLYKINWVMMRYSVVTRVLAPRSRFFRLLGKFNPWSWGTDKLKRGEAIRKSFESLGPIFVKFGQLLSTRRDLLPHDIVEELAKLQDQVPPFKSELAISLIEKALKQSVEQAFKSFDAKPLASASVAQVHAATLVDDSDVVVKIIRPGIKHIIASDIKVLYTAARLAEKFWRHGKRIKPTALVKEFEQTIFDELDLMREAANASLLRRNFEGSKKLYVPKVYWDYCKTNVMVMERIYGEPVSNIALFKQKNVDMKKLGEYGVEIFFTQVFRDSFFHADMHPGNIFVDIKDPKNPKYCGVDFGIMGTLAPEDQHYLAENVMAFFERDYRRVATLHVESGWVPADTRVDQFEAAIRTVCEPIFQKPLNEISFGQLLLRLFQTAERFNMTIQPQLLLLQKTLLNVEGLGRDLYPELDLWSTAQPILKKWMRERYSVKRTVKKIVKDLPRNLEQLIETPEMLFDIIRDLHQRYVREKNHSSTTK